jgi:cyanate permease
MRRLPLLAAGLVLTGLNLRIALASVPPILSAPERHPGKSRLVSAGSADAAPVVP